MILSMKKIKKIELFLSVLKKATSYILIDPVLVVNATLYINLLIMTNSTSC
jgi:hypothetical protein